MLREETPDHDAALSNLNFKQLNYGWNADPNCPEPEVAVNGSEVKLAFFLNHWAYEAGKDEKGTLVFRGCSFWRLGPTNDEGWYAGQCRYSNTAPAWGEFYELLGEDDQRFMPADWHKLGPLTSGLRHFLFYLRDETFECFGADWKFERSGASIYRRR